MTRPSAAREEAEARFRVLGRLYQGQRRSVFEALDLERSEKVALKVASDPKDADVVAELEREGAALARVRHPHIVSLVAAGSTPEHGSFVATRLMTGQSLAEVMARHAPIPDAFRRAVMKQLLEALAAIHERGGVHADVSPANCFCEDFRSVDEPPQLVLLDLGASRWAEDDARASRPITATYTSPEQARGDLPTKESDLYSAGVIGYELLLGVPPFRASTSTEVLWQHLHERPPALPIGARSAFAAAILRALEKEPTKRFSSAHELADALDADADAATSETGTEAALLEPSAVRRALAARVREHWVEGFLSRATEGVILVNQGVRRADELVVDCRAAIGEELASGVGAAFEDAQRSLLLLGDVGHGKTVNLLRLARRLLDDTENGPAPVPVVLALSSWSGTQDLVDWVAAELSAKYLVPRRAAAALLRDGELVPLLDGLDEVPIAVRSHCIEAINRFREQHPSHGIVVSCRLGDYAQSPTPLRLRGAVVLDKLRRNEIARQLRAAAQTELLDALREHEHLDELAQTPVLLHVMRVALRDSTSFREVLSDRTTVIRTLFERFTVAVCRSYETDEGVVKTPLARAASLLKRSGKTLLLLEDLQPSWLETARDRFLYVLVTRWAAAALFAASIILAMGLSPIDNGGFQTSIGFSTRLAAITTVVLGTAYSAYALLRFRRASAPPASIPWRLARALTCGAISGAVIGGIVFLQERHHVTFVIGIQCGVLGSLILGLSRKSDGDPTRDVTTVEQVRWALRHFTWRRVGLLGLFATAMFLAKRGDDGVRAATYDALTVLILGLGILGFRAEAVEQKLTPNIGIRLTARNALFAFAATFATMTPLFGLSYGLAYGACVALTLGTVMALWLGGIDVINHYVLRALLHSRDVLRFRATDTFDVAVRLGLMRRVGSGFMFMHGLLLEHFASTDPETTSS